MLWPLSKISFPFFLSTTAAWNDDGNWGEYSAKCEDHSQQVIIVGPGMSGLSAAKFLQDRDWREPSGTGSEIDFNILESSRRIGGRISSKPVQFDDGQVWLEICASWIYDRTPNNDSNVRNPMCQKYS